MTPRILVPATLAALLAAGTALTAIAQTAPAPQPPAPAPAPAAPGMDRGPGMGPGAMFFAQADADKDGKVTEDEFRAFRAARIEGLDADGDGLISKEELTAHYLKMTEAMIAARVDRQIARGDVDGDGKLSAAELAVGMEDGMGPRLFDRADADDDGAVTQDELGALARRGGDRSDGPRGRFEGRGGPDDHRMGGPRGRHGDDDRDDYRHGRRGD